MKKTRSLFEFFLRRTTRSWWLALLLVTVGAVAAEAAPFAYVTNEGFNNVSVIDTATNTVVAAVPVGSRPRGVAITPDGAFAYVANWNNDFPPVTISVIDTDPASPRIIPWSPR